MLYKIDFEVDNDAIDNETCISQIFNISIFTGIVFTGKHSFKE